MKNKIIIKYYSLDAFLKILYENNIEAESIVLLDDFHICLYVDDKDLKKIRKLNIKYKKEKESYLQKFIHVF